MCMTNATNEFFYLAAWWTWCVLTCSRLCEDATIQWISDSFLRFNPFNPHRRRDFGYMPWISWGMVTLTSWILPLRTDDSREYSKCWENRLTRIQCKGQGTLKRTGFLKIGLKFWGKIETAEMTKPICMVFFKQVDMADGVVSRREPPIEFEPMLWFEKVTSDLEKTPGSSQHQWGDEARFEWRWDQFGIGRRLKTWGGSCS